jgi:hypothetical protein
MEGSGHRPIRVQPSASQNTGSKPTVMLYGTPLSAETAIASTRRNATGSTGAPRSLKIAKRGACLR